MVAIVFKILLRTINSELSSTGQAQDYCGSLQTRRLSCPLTHPGETTCPAHFLQPGHDSAK